MENEEREAVLPEEGLKNAARFWIYDPQPPIIHLKKRTAVKVIVIPSIFFIFLFYGIFENDDYGREKAESNEEYKYLELNYHIVSNPTFLITQTIYVCVKCLQKKCEAYDKTIIEWFT